MPDGARTQKKGRKYDQILNGALDVFLSDGFEGASVDDIARAASVSKATLYSYFSDKRILFMEAARLEMARQAETRIALIDFEAPVTTILREGAAHMVQFMTSDFGQRMFRLCVAESARFPELGKAFFETGPQKVRGTLVELFKMKVAAGELAIDDLELAADQFHELCKAEIFTSLVFNVQTTFTQAELDRVIDGAVSTFMARYGA